MWWLWWGGSWPGEQDVGWYGHVQGLVRAVLVVVLVELGDQGGQFLDGGGPWSYPQPPLEGGVQPFVLARVVGLLGRPVIGVTPWRRR